MDIAVETPTSRISKIYAVDVAVARIDVHPARRYLVAAARRWSIYCRVCTAGVIIPNLIKAVLVIHPATVDRAVGTIVIVWFKSSVQM